MLAASYCFPPRRPQTSGRVTRHAPLETRLSASWMPLVQNADAPPDPALVNIVPARGVPHAGGSGVQNSSWSLPIIGLPSHASGAPMCPQSFRAANRDFSAQRASLLNLIFSRRNSRQGFAKVAAQAWEIFLVRKPVRRSPRCLVVTLRQGESAATSASGLFWRLGPNAISSSRTTPVNTF
jgi:hypothetical protein